MVGPSAGHWEGGGAAWEKEARDAPYRGPSCAANKEKEERKKTNTDSITHRTTRNCSLLECIMQNVSARH